MPLEILMPVLSPTMTVGNIVGWLKQEGEAVAAGDVLVEIETDKATVELEADEDGILGPVIKPAGSMGVAVREPIAWLLLEGEDSAALGQISPSSEAGNGNKIVPNAKDTQAGKGLVALEAKASVTGASVTGASVTGGVLRSIATPLARRMARQAGLDLSKITGTGPRGRIRKADIESATATLAAQVQLRHHSQSDAIPTDPVTPSARLSDKQGVAGLTPVGSSSRDSGSRDCGDGKAQALADALGMSYQLIPNSAIRKVIARRLSESKQTIAHFYLTVDCQLDELLKLRKQLNEQLSESKLSVNDFVIRAVALALKRCPEANVAWSEQAILRYHHADIAVAVATCDGLITPVVRQAETKGLSEISREVKDLAARARTGKLKPVEFQGGTFTISNLGMYGVREFAAIINPPQACILAVGQGAQQAVVRDGQLAIATMMSCTLSADHRAVDGVLGAKFLAAFKQLIEVPMTMLL